MSARYQSSNLVPVDRPFAKLLYSQADLADIAGIPPISSAEYSFLNSQVYDRASALMGLNSRDPRQVARRVRHLSYVLRSSRFSDRIEWRSCLKELDSIAPVFDEPSGLIDVTGAVSGLTVNLLTAGTRDSNRSSWRLSISGTTNFQLYVDGLAVGSTFSNASPLPATQVPGSGHAVAASCSAGTVFWGAELRVPYSGDLADLVNSLRANRQFFLQLQPAQEYVDAFIHGDVVEDAVAAFILSVDSI
jgi:hypothetical protein